MMKSKLINTDGLNLNDNTLYLNRDYYLYYFEDNSGNPCAIVYENDGWSTIGTVTNPDKYFENFRDRRKRIIKKLFS